MSAEVLAPVSTGEPQSVNTPNEHGIASVRPSDLLARPDLTGEPQWYYSEGIAGEGDRPEWLPEGMNMMQYGEQSKNNEERANGLRRELSGVKHAPETYTVSIDEDIASYFGIEDNDPMIETFMSSAKDSDLSQEGFNNILTAYFEKQSELVMNRMDAADAEFKEMGMNKDETFEQLSNWMNINLSVESADAFSNFITSAPAAKAMQEFISKTSTMNNIPTNVGQHNYRTERENQLDVTKKFMSGGVGALDALNRAYNVK